MRFIHLIEAMEDNSSIFRARDNNRQDRYIQIITKQIQDYIDNGSQGLLDLNNCPLNTLPETLKRAESLMIEMSQIQTLPKGLVIEKSLFAGHSKLQNIDDISVQRNIFAAYTPIDHLPENLVLKSNLILEGTKIKELPRGLRARVLNIERTQVSTIPGDIEVEAIYLMDTPLARNKDAIAWLKSRGIRVVLF